MRILRVLRLPLLAMLALGGYWGFSAMLDRDQLEWGVGILAIAALAFLVVLTRGGAEEKLNQHG